MSIGAEVCYNGMFYKRTAVPIPAENRAFLYGDLIFETFFASDMRIMFYEKHIERLKKAAELLQIEIPENYLEAGYFQDETLKLLNRNKHYKGARVRLNLFRKNGGLYAPQSNEAEYSIESSALAYHYFQFDNKGIQLEIFDKHRIQANEFTPFKLGGNSRVHTLAGIHKTKSGADDCLILNSAGNIAETISSNIFLIVEKTVYTPPVSDGCVEGIVRSVIPEMAQRLGFGYQEKSISQEMFLSADEIFTTNSVQGVRSIKSIGTKRYFIFIGKQFSDALNRLIPE